VVLPECVSHGYNISDGLKKTTEHFIVLMIFTAHSFGDTPIPHIPIVLLLSTGCYNSINYRKCDQCAVFCVTNIFQIKKLLSLSHYIENLNFIVDSER
jgi:hypothetical protein